MFRPLAVLTLAFCAAQAAAPPRILGTLAAEGKIAVLPDGTWHSYIVTGPRETGPQILTRRISRDNGLTWTEPQGVNKLAGTGWAGLLVLPDRKGELQVVIMRYRGNGGKIALDRFIDLWQLRTTHGQTGWTEPQRIFEGYVGSIQQMLQLRSGRLLLPFALWVGGRAQAPPNGPNETTAVYSDDDGVTWKQSPSRLTAPVFDGFNGGNVGAIEPSVLERRDGTLWMLLRTQTGFYYESTSRDGSEWTPAVACGIHASTGPPFLLRLTDGRVVLFLNHVEMPPRVKGEGVYGGRDALHAAISADDGRTWRGFREVYRDPFRHETPPKRGDRGTAYPFATNVAGGKIALTSGQGENRRAILLVDPDWLMETEATNRPEEAPDEWTRFLGVGPASNWWQDRVEGARIVPGRGLEVSARKDLPRDSAVWNFPLGKSGKLKLTARGQGGELALTQRLFEPGDDNGETQAVFRASLPNISGSAWHEIDLDWNAETGPGRLLLDGKPAGELKQQNLEDKAASYLRLRATSGTLYVKQVSASVNP